MKTNINNKVKSYKTVNKICFNNLITIFLFFNFQLLTFNCFSQTLQALTDTNVIFYDYIPDVVVTNPYTDTLRIDIDQNGVNDIQFYINTYPYQGAYVKTLNSGCKIAFFLPSANDSISSSNLIWQTGDCYWNDSYNFQNRLGVKITVGSNKYYGWVHVTYSLGPMAFTIDKYAFCKIANYPFHIGQTTISTNVPNINTLESTTVYVGNLGTSVIVQSGKIIKNVTVTSAAGVVAASQNNINSYSANISTAGVAHGSYIVQVQFTDLTVFTKQIVI